MRKARARNPAAGFDPDGQKEEPSCSLARLDALAATAGLVCGAEQGLDAGIHNRWHIRTYAMGSRTAVREAPLARDPQGFIDEWLARSRTAFDKLAP